MNCGEEISMGKAVCCKEYYIIYHEASKILLSLWLRKYVLCSHTSTFKCQEVCLSAQTHENAV